MEWGCRHVAHLRVNELPHPVRSQNQELVLRAHLHHTRLRLCKKQGQEEARTACASSG